MASASMRPMGGRMRRRAPATVGDGGSRVLRRSIHSAGSSAPPRAPKSSDSQSLTDNFAETSGGTSARTTPSAPLSPSPSTSAPRLMSKSRAQSLSWIMSHLEIPMEQSFVEFLHLGVFRFGGQETLA